MEMNDILTLARAGFTAQQIGALSAIGKEKEAPAQTASTQSFLNNNTSNPVSPGAVPGVQASAAPSMQDLMSVMQNMNIMMSNQPQTDSVDDILASIINPPDSQAGTAGGTQ